MNYEGNESFKTLFGACLSIFVGIVILSFLVLKVTVLLNRLDAKTTQEILVTNLEKEPPLFAHKNGFNFAFTSMHAPEERFGSFHLYYINVTYKN